MTYDAARAMFGRVNASLGTHWSLHDLRHTAAYRMARDPRMPLTDVQWVLGHAFFVDDPAVSESGHGGSYRRVSGLPCPAADA
ncbi:hypothetical protein ACTXI4_18070 [Glutamicibacter ardleyensis]|uniref:hypothetical protein n=1 Tax=Glutamicibacter ardleyensis TaxID=225894 RepID=UPI003FD041E0